MPDNDIEPDAVGNESDETPMEPGYCLGHYDGGDASCRKCEIGASCKDITEARAELGDDALDDENSEEIDENGETEKEDD